MKSCTDIEQSKKLASILPLESADMWWNFYSVTTDDTTPRIIHLDTPWAGNFNWDNKPDNIPCWSLAALFNELGKIKEHYFYHLIFDFTLNKYSVEVEADSWRYEGGLYDNAVDACVDAIIAVKKGKVWTYAN